MAIDPEHQGHREHRASSGGLSYFRAHMPLLAGAALLLAGTIVYFNRYVDYEFNSIYTSSW